MGVLLGPALVSGNRIETLLNGNEIFPAMLKAIREAEKTITFETYIYWSGVIGKEFVDTLSEKARQGVRIHVLLDWVGSEKMEESAIRQCGMRVLRSKSIMRRSGAAGEDSIIALTARS